MARQTNETNYLSSSFAVAIDIIDKVYLIGENGVPSCYRGLFQGKRNQAVIKAYWGTCDDATGRGLKIGARGKILGLCALYSTIFPEVLDKDPVSWKTVATEITTAAVQTSAPRRAKDAMRELAKIKATAEEYQDTTKEFERNTADGRFVSLIKTAESRTVSPAEFAPHFVAAVAGFFAMKLAMQKKFLDAEAAFSALTDWLAQPFSSPSHCAKTVASHLGLSAPASSGVTKQGTKDQASAINLHHTIGHHIEPTLNAYVRRFEGGRHGDDALNNAVTKVRTLLTSTNQARLFVLTGPAHVGKKAVVGDLVFVLKEEADRAKRKTYSLPFTDFPRPTVQLPLFAVSAQGRDYLTMIVEIIVFLERYRLISEGKPVEPFEKLVKDRLAREDAASVSAIETLLDEVEEKHRGFPAFFVILDVHGSRADSVLKVIRNYGINRVLRTLLKSTDSRILITDPEGGGDAYEFLDGGHKPHLELLDPPTIRRLPWYIAKDREADVVYALDRLAPDKTTVATNGTALIGLAALLAETEKTPGRIRTVITEHIELMRAGAAVATDDVFERLLKAYDTAGCLEAIALICASEDGVTCYSLEQSLKHWPGRTETDASIQRTIGKLEVIAKRSTWMLIEREEIINFDPEEYSLGEKADTKDGQKHFDISQDAREAVLAALQKTAAWAEISRIAHRLIAIAARRRAQIKKMHSTAYGSGSRTQEARDIQSYVAMLASIDPASLARQCAQIDKDSEGENDGCCERNRGRSLRLSSDRVFTSDGFDPRLALRFAVRCQLHEDIDRDFRLSMVSDQDELRLRLYLLPFSTLGKPHAWRIEDLRKANLESTDREEPFEDLQAIPDHMKAVFTDAEILDLLVTISLTAFHCQFPAMIDWAVRRAEELQDRPDKIGWWIAVTRIRCSILDMRIQLGHAYEASLEQLRDDWTKPPIENFDPSAIARQKKIEANDLEALKAWMRLRAREAELEWLIKGGEGTNGVLAIYAELSMFEHALAESIDQDDPIVLSGRTARRCIKFMSNDAPVYRRLVAPEAVSEETLELIRHMLEANISRLRRFSGADRVGVLVDMARCQYLDGQYDQAVYYIDLAVSTTFSGSVSHGGKIDVLSISAGLHLFMAERLIATDNADDEVRRHLNEAHSHCKLLKQLADALNFEPSKALSKYLNARYAFALCESEAKNAPDRPADISAAWKLVDKAIDYAEKECGSAAAAPMRDLKALVRKFHRDRIGDDV